MTDKIKAWWKRIWKGLEFGTIDNRTAYISTGCGYTPISRELLDDFVSNTYIDYYRDRLAKEMAAEIIRAVIND